MKQLLATLIVATTVFGAAIAEIPHISGGVGKESRDMILAQSRKFNLQVKAAFTTGHYISGVELVIKDSRGSSLLVTETDGPLFFAKLEPGQYTLHASFEGEDKSQKFTIAEQTPLREVMLRFTPDSPPVE